MSSAISFPDDATIKGVYYIEEPNMNPIAIRPDIRSGYFSWEDTGHGRTTHYTSIFFNEKKVNKPFTSPKIPPGKIDVVKTNLHVLHFVLLTKKIFDEKLKDIVAGGASLNFQDDEAVQKYFLTTNFGQ